MGISKSEKNSIFISLLLLFGAAWLVLYVRFENFTNPYVFNEDIRWVMSWVYRFHDNKLFQDDFISAYTYRIAPLGIKALYYAGSYILDPVVLAKIIPIAMYLLSVFLVLGFAYSAAGSVSAFFAGLIFVFLAWPANPSGVEMFGPGDGGDFYFPLSIIFLYALNQKKYLSAAVALLLQLLFYPPLFLIGSCALLIHILINRLDFYARVICQKRRLFYLLFCLAACAFVVVNYIQPNKFSDTYTKKEMLTMEEFHSGGRINVFPGTFNEWISSDTVGFCLDPPMLLLFLCALFLLIKLRRKALAVPAELYYFIISGFALFLASQALLPMLYVPAKYIGIPIIIFFIFFIAINIRRVYAGLHIYYRRTGFFIVSVSFIFFSWLFFMGGIKRQDTRLSSSEITLLNFLSRLPDKSLIAGHPSLMNNVHIFSKRKVFVTEELSMPFHRHYYDEIKKRTFDFFGTYYANNEQAIKKFCCAYGVTHLVINAEHFEPGYIEKKEFYLKPFNAYIAGLTKKTNFFFLSQITQEKKIFEDKKLSVIECGCVDGSRQEVE